MSFSTEVGNRALRAFQGRRAKKVCFVGDFVLFRFCLAFGSKVGLVFLFRVGPLVTHTDLPEKATL